MPLNIFFAQDKIRPLWRHYFQNTQGLIFVVDSNDRYLCWITFQVLTIFRSQGKSRRGTRRADEDARRGRAEGGGEPQDSAPLVQHQPPYYDFRCCWSSPTSRTCRMQWTPPRSLTSWVCTAWGTETGTFRWYWDSTRVPGGHLCLISGHLRHLRRRSLRGARLAEQPAQERRPLSSPSSSRPSLDIDHRIYTRGSSSI